MNPTRHRRVALIIFWALVIATAVIVGCGKYGKPIRRQSAPEEPAEQLVGERAESGEKRYTFSK